MHRIAPDRDILLQSSPHVPRNYKANTYPFHQDSTWLYFTGLTRLANAALLIAADGKETLFMPPTDPDDVIWTGLIDMREAHAKSAEIENIDDIGNLDTLLKPRLQNLAFIAPHDPQHKIRLAHWLNTDVHDIENRASTELMLEIYNLRAHKDETELAYIAAAVEISRQMYESAQKVIRPGATESQVMAALIEPLNAQNSSPSFQPIVTVQGERLHNEYYDNVLCEGDILLIDSGAEVNGYCSDITRCFPVSGSFTPPQQAIYDIVLRAQLAAIEQTRIPNTTNRHAHETACLEIAHGLIEIGLMSGDAQEAVNAGAHALFMPHGIGHMLGLDVHDMENFGDLVGYAPGTSRSAQFGLNALRLARELEPGFVLTVEPGIYFIPELIHRWEEKQHLANFINYPNLSEYLNFGGIRIEDDIAISTDGSMLIGNIPK